MIRSPFRLLPALACLALAAGLLAACGGDKENEETAAQILQQTFRGDSSIDDGSLALTFQLDPEGLLAVGGPVRFTLDGPFRAPRAGELTRFDVDFVATLAEKDYSGGVLSTGKQALVTLDDGTYKVGQEVVDKLRRFAGKGNGLAVTGFDPLRWISAPQKKGDERVGGVETTRIGGKLDVEALLADLDGLLTKAGGSQSTSTLLAPKLRKQIAAAVNSSSVDIWTGASDRLVRQLAVKIVFFFNDDSSPLQALNGGTINLRLRLDDVNRKAAPASAFTAPEDAATRPLADLTGGSPANILDGLGAGLTGGKGRPLFACLTAGEGSSSRLVRCVSKLAR
jgi:ABC-type amino acid transport substrate-binding protein